MLYPGGFYPGQNYPSQPTGVTLDLDPAVETETARAVDPVVHLAVAAETEQALPLGLGVELTLAAETEQTFPVGLEQDLRPAGEVETVTELQYIYFLTLVEEREFGLPVEVRLDRRFITVAPMAPGPRVIAQDITTGAFLHWDLPVHDLSLTETLSGPSAITGKLDPDIRDLRELPLRPWSTWIHVESDDGLIRGSGVLTTPFGVDGTARSLEVIGVSAYPQHVLFEGAYSQVGVDPLDVVRYLWQYTNTFSGKLGVVVSADKSTVRIGGAPPPSTGTLTGPRIDIGAEPTETEGKIEYKPYELTWWEATVIGTEIDKLADNTPFDYVETSAWNAARTGVVHRVNLGYPRVGTRRFDLRFVDGENIKGSIPVVERDDAFVTDVRVFGAGEGQAMVRGTASRALNQLRRVATITEKSIKTNARAKQVADAELKRRCEPRGMTSVLLDAKHENAPVGSFAVGDDIFIQTEVDWIGEVNMWHRVLDFTYTPDEEAVAVNLAPSSTFRYGSAA